MAADWEGIHPRELRQMEEIRELDMEELNVETDDEGGDEEEEEEEEEGDGEEEDVDYSHLLAIRSFTRLDGGNGSRVSHEASLHAYLGEVDDTPGRKVALLDAGATLSMPMLFLPGVVLFPEATLPLRLIEARLVAAVEKALRHVDAPNTIGVVLMYRRPNHRYYASALVGTTAEIRQLGRLDDGSVNVKARGQQRFRLIRHWQDVDGVVWGKVQIIEEDAPLRTPRDAFAQLAASSSVRPHTSSPVTSLDVSSSEQHDLIDSDIDSDTPSQKSTASDQSVMVTKTCYSGSQSSNSMKFCISGGQSGKNTNMHEDDYVCLASPSSTKTTDTKQRHQYTAASYSKQPCQASLSFWPRWAYEMYDSYALARRAAGLWRLIIKKQSMDDYVTKPDLLSFYIGSQLPVSEPLRQKLLEIDGVSYRLRREIQLLNACDIMKCRDCKSEIAKRSDVVAMSSDGPLGTYVNPHGFVHATITVNNATGLALEGSPSKIHSWFPGYAWTIVSCAECGSNIGWLFSTTKKHLQPKSFWGIRSSQIADIVEEEQQEE